MVFIPSDSHSTPHLNLGVLAPYVRPYVKNLGVLLDSDLKLDRQVNQVVKLLPVANPGKNEVLSFFYQL